MVSHLFGWKELIMGWQKKTEMATHADIARQHWYAHGMGAQTTWLNQLFTYTYACICLHPYKNVYAQLYGCIYVYIHIHIWPQRETLNKKYVWYDMMTISKIYVEFHEISSCGCPWKDLGGPFDVLGGALGSTRGVAGGSWGVLGGPRGLLKTLVNSTRTM